MITKNNGPIVVGIFLFIVGACCASVSYKSVDRLRNRSQVNTNNIAPFVFAGLGGLSLGLWGYWKTLGPQPPKDPNIEKLHSKGDVQGLIRALDSRYEISNAATNALLTIEDDRTIHLLTEALKDDSQRKRQQIAAVLGMMGPSKVDRWASMLKDGDWRIRAGMLRALSWTKDERVYKLLMEGLKDANSHVRNEAKDLIYDGVRSEDAVLPLIALLHDQTHDIVPIIEALGHYHDVQAIDPLIKLLGKSRDAIERAVVDALQNIGKPAIVPLIRKLDNENPAVVKLISNALVKIGAAAVEPLIVSLLTANANVRRTVLSTLGEIGDARALIPLLNESQDNDAQEAAILAIGKLKNRQAVPSLLAYLQHSDKNVRRATIWALGQIKDEQAIEPLVSTLQDSDKELCKIALDILITFETKALVTTLSGKSTDVWRMVIERIGEAGNNQKLQAFVDALPSQQEQVQRVVTQYLTQKDYDFLPPKWPVCIGELFGPASSSVSVRNPNSFVVRVGLRSGERGKDFKVPPAQSSSVSIQNGSYKVYFQFSTDPLELQQGDDVHLSGQSIQISIVEARGGNYGIKKVR